MCKLYKQINSKLIFKGRQGSQKAVDSRNGRFPRKAVYSALWSLSSSDIHSYKNSFIFIHIKKDEYLGLFLIIDILFGK